MRRTPTQRRLESARALLEVLVREQARGLVLEREVSFWKRHVQRLEEQARRRESR